MHLWPGPMRGSSYELKAAYAWTCLSQLLPLKTVSVPKELAPFRFQG